MIPVIRDVEYTLTFVATMLAVIVAIFDRSVLQPVKSYFKNT